MRSAVLLGSISLLLSACATSAPKCACRPSGAGMSLDEARSIVAEFEASQAQQDAANPLREPKSLEDALSILKSDQLDLFPAGVAFASKQPGVEAKALAGQIELAWGEAELTLAEIFSLLAANQEQTVREVEPSGLDVAELRERMFTNRTMAEALTRLAAEHSAEGGRRAREVIEATPGDYQGYRVAADYFRMRERWEEFGATLSRIAELKSDSNGLVFLRGVGALYRDSDGPTADRYFRQALAKDPQFVRAQVQLVRSQRGFAAKYAEYEKLKALNPHHQIVVWAGPALERAKAERAAGGAVKAP